MAFTYLKTAQPRPAEESNDLSDIVATMLTDIARHGEDAVRRYAEKLDGWTGEIILSDPERTAAIARVPEDLKADIRFAHDNIRRFAETQKATLRECEIEVIDGMIAGQNSTPIDNYSTLSRRARHLKMVRSRRAQRQGPLHLVIDSTGLKLFGEGEWKRRVPGASKRRSWRKLHLAVDAANSEILAHCLTDRDQADNAQLGPLLDQIEGSINKVSSDKAYDSHACHNAIVARGATPLIPPRRGASSKPGPHQNHPAPTRAQTAREIQKHGRKVWKTASGYHRRSLAETAMGRFKAILGPELKSRERTRQIAEVDIKVEILNRFAQIAMAVSVKRA